MAFVIMKKAGEPGSVAVNSEQVTHVRSTGTRFTDIFFRDCQVSVEATFEQVVALLDGRSELPGGQKAKSWIQPTPAPRTFHP